MISFLHTADLHLGMRTNRFDAVTSAKIREARFTALENIPKTAKERKVDFVLIAGDLFDDSAVDAQTARRGFEILDDMPMPVFVLPGNHDPLLAGGVWDRPPWKQRVGKRVRLLADSEPVEMDGAVLFPCPVLRKTSIDDPTRWISSAPATPGKIRLGIAHGSLRIRDDLPLDDHLIARDAATDFRLDYLALGHWHSRRLIADREGIERTAYPGVHEPMRFQGSTDGLGWIPYGGAGRQEFLDSGRGEVLHVRIPGPQQQPVIEAIEVGHYIWREETCELACDDDVSKLINELGARPDPGRRLLKLYLRGVLNANSISRIEDVRKILIRYFVSELDVSDLHLQPTVEEMQEVAGQGVLKRVLEKLQIESSSADAKSQQVAERAILLLYQLAKEAQE